MSYPISRHEQEISVAANARYTLPLGNADYIRFHTVPAGVMVRLNGGSAGAFIQGETHQGEPGTGELREVSFENTTGGPLSVRVIFGLGRLEVTGVATITGAVPLPSDAAQASKQDAQTAHLATLATTVVRSPKLRAIAGGASETVAACRWIEFFNKSTTANMTVTITGEAAYTFGPREGGGLPLLHPREGNYPQIVVACAAGGSGVVSYIV